MTEQALYVYAIGRDLEASGADFPEAVDGSAGFEVVEFGGLSALVTMVAREAFAQEAVDAHAADLQWLGTIGLRHQAVVARLASTFTIIPLRAFTMFRTDTSLRDYLSVEGPTLRAILDRLDGKEEWTFRIELDPERWDKALLQRVEPLRQISQEIEAAPEGKAYLLRKKLEVERVKAAESAERQLVGEIEEALMGATSAPAIVENRQLRAGSFPQITLLLPRGSQDAVSRISEEIGSRYSGEGVSFAVTGPWPPYTFAMEDPNV